jgi:hypothetical protein
MPLSLAMISPEVHRTIQRPHRLHRRSEWPRSMKQILPHGAEDTFRAITTWLLHKPDPPTAQNLIHVLRVLFSACKTEIATYAVESEGLKRAVFEERNAVTYHLPVELERPRLDRQFWTNFEQIQTRSSDFIQLLLFQVFDEVQMIKFLEHNYGPDVLFNVCDQGMQASVFIDQMRQKRILPTIKRGDDLLIYQNAELIGILMAYFPHVRNMEVAPGADRLIDKYIPDWNSPSAVAWWRLQRLFMFIWRR